MTPQPSAAQKIVCDRLNGLPFVCLDVPLHKIMAVLSNGEKVRAVELEEIFNAGLVVEAMEGPGSAARQTMTNEAATRLHHELIARAEQAFGVTIQDALPVYLAMDRHSYARWDERPRVKWSRPTVN